METPALLLFKLALVEEYGIMASAFALVVHGMDSVALRVLLAKI